MAGLTEVIRYAIIYLNTCLFVTASARTDLKKAEKRQSFGFEIRRPYLGPSIPVETRIDVIGLAFSLQAPDRPAGT
jgi:hypothetical protein